MYFSVIRVTDKLNMGSLFLEGAQTLNQALFLLSKNPKMIQEGCTLAGPLDRRAEVEDMLWKNYRDVELNNLLASGTAQMWDWVKAGYSRSVANAKWIEAHYAEFDKKREEVRAGKEVDLNPTRDWKPYSYADCKNEALAKAAEKAKADAEVKP